MELEDSGLPEAIDPFPSFIHPIITLPAVASEIQRTFQFLSEAVKGAAPLTP